MRQPSAMGAELTHHDVKMLNGFAQGAFGGREVRCTTCQSQAQVVFGKGTALCIHPDRVSFDASFDLIATCSSVMICHLFHQPPFQAKNQASLWQRAVAGGEPDLGATGYWDMAALSHCAVLSMRPVRS